MHMKQVLIVDYGLMGIFNLRTLKFVRYLSSFGWQPVILSARHPYGKTYDRTILEQIPSRTQIYQTATLEPVRLLRWRHGLKTVLRRNRICEAGAHLAETDGADVNEVDRLRRGLPGKVARWVSRCLLIPDHAIGWLPFALARALPLLWRNQCQLIYTVSHPNSAHLVGLFLKKLTGKPWVADFKDAWVTGQRGVPAAPRWRVWIERRMEAAAMTAADRIVSVSRPIVHSLTEVYGRNGRGERFSVITNGFDPDDFTGMERGERLSGRFSIAYLGTLWDDISCRTFLQALDELVTERRDLLGEITAFFIGNIRGQREREWLQGRKFRADVRFRSRVPHRMSLRYMKAADALLLLINRSERCQGTYTQKLFQYLGAGRPILGLVPSGAAADLIRETGAGVVADPDDRQAIKQTIVDLYDRFLTGRRTTAADADFLRRFENKRLTGDLAGIFDHLYDRLPPADDEVRYHANCRA